MEERTLLTAFTAGNIVVYRIGDGTTIVGQNPGIGTQVFIDEYTPTGTLVQSVAVPTAANGANHAFVAGSSSNSEGELNVSADGRFLIFTGYDAPVGTSSLAASSSTAFPRVVAVMSIDGSVDTTTALTDFSNGNNPRGATSTDGVHIWLAAQETTSGGIRYIDHLGGTTSIDLSGTTIKNVRDIQIVNGQLYFSGASSGVPTNVSTYGTGLPTSSATAAALNGIPTSTGNSPNAFFFADLSSSVAGLDTLYIADDTGLALTKYSFDGTTWTAKGKIGLGSDDYFGLTGVVNGSTVTLYATKLLGNTSAAQQLVKIVDSSGYGGTLSGTPTVLVTAATNTIIHGVALTPNVAAQLTNSATLSYNAGAAASVLSSSITVADTSGSFKGGSLTISLSAGESLDQLAIKNQGTGAGQIGVSGSNVTYGGTTIGTFTGGANGSSLVVSFTTSAATANAVQALMQQITFQTSSSQAIAKTPIVNFQITEADGKASNQASVTVTINNAPVLAVNSGVTAGNGAGVVIGNGALLATDSESPASQITFTVTTATTHGTLKRSGSNLSSGSTFTQSDLNAGIISYTHDGSATTSDGFSFTVVDGGGSSSGTANFNITVSAAVNLPPVLVNNSGLTVLQGQSGIVDATALRVTDADNTTTQLIFTVGTATTHGTLKNGTTALTAGSQFTQADVDAGRINYTQNGSLFAADSFTFSVSDGAGGAIGSTTFNISVTLNAAPVLALNLGVSVNEGATVTLTNAKLKVTDADNTASQLVYTIGTTPIHGALLKNGSALSTGEVFTQADVDAGKISYTHDGGETTVDSFTFTVSDGAGGSIALTTFNITVSPVDDAPILAKNLGITANPGGGGVLIGNDRLQATDVDNTAAQLIYTLTAKPIQGAISLNGVVLNVNGTFTQADVDGGKLAYTPGTGTATSDGFTFTISDGAGGAISSTTFAITLSPLSVNFSGGVYTQNFNSLPSGGTYSLVGTGPFGLDASPLNAAAQGWFMGQISGTGTTANFDVGDGTANNNRLIDYGSVGSSDRAIGTFAGGSLIGAFGVVLVNNTGTTLASVNLSYLGEQWSYGGTSPDVNALLFSYGLGLTPADLLSTAAGKFTSATALNFNSPITSGAARTLDGNATANRTQVSGTLTGLNWLPGQTLVLRWNDVNDSGTDDGLAIDDFSLTAATAPLAVTANTGLTVNQGTGGTITTSLLNVNNPAAVPTSQLTYTVGTAPTHGTLIRNGVTLSSGGTFTQADIDSGKLSYVQNGTAFTSDSFRFTVSDGAGGAIALTTFNIVITPVNGTPSLVKNLGINANPGGGGVIIGNDRLQVTDADNTAAQLVYTLTAKPGQGSLALNGTTLNVNGTFTQADVDGKKLTYVPAAGSATSDAFTFTVSDGTGGTIGATTFNITLSPLSIGFAGGTYTQNFDTLPASGTFSLVGTGPFGLNASPLDAAAAAGWFMGQISGTGGTANFDAADGTGNNNALHSYGSVGATDRAIGTFAGNSLIGAFGVVLINTSGVTLTSIDLSYFGEEWSYGGTSPDVNQLALSYGLGLTTADLLSTSAGKFTAVSALNFHSPVTSGAARTLDGNAAANRTLVSGQIAGITWLPGQTLVLRWEDTNDSGTDDGLAIDNVSITSTLGPKLTTNAGLTLLEGATSTITNALLQVIDTNAAASQLVYTVGTAPIHGSLLKNGSTLSAGGTFTQADVNAGLLSYRHDGGETTSDSFTFTVSDGAGGSIALTTFNVTVTPVNDVPILAKNIGIVANPGGDGVIIGNDRLQVTDVDNTAAQVTYKVTATPTRGTLAVNGTTLTVNGTFKQSDIDAKKLVYTPAAGSATSDAFTFTVSDGSGGTIGATTFNITLSPLSIGFAGGTYTQNFNTLPASGAFSLVGKGPFGLDASPLDAVAAAGWFMGQISGTGATANFDAVDGTGNNNALHSYGSVGATDRAIGTFAGGSLIGAFGVVLINNSGVTLTSIDLSYFGEQWSYGGTSPNVNQLALSYGLGLTAADLLSTAPGKFTAVSALNFHSPVTSGAARTLDGNTSANRTLVSGQIVGINWLPGQSIVLRWEDANDSGTDDGLAIDDITITSIPKPSVSTNAGLTVSEGGSGTLTNAMLSVTDFGLAPASIQYTLQLGGLSHGALLMNGAALGAGSTFTQADINAGKISYRHDGGETTADAFSFTVTDTKGQFVGKTSFQINVLPVNDAPTIAVNKGLYVQRGATLALSGDVLQIADSDNTTAQRLLTVTTVPTHGTLYKGATVLTTNSTFTQADVENKLIKYVQNGDTSTSDGFTFTVSDGSGGTIGATRFNIAVGVNHAPTMVAQTFSLYKLAPNATVVGTMQATDADLGQTLTYSIQSGNNGAFAINAVTGVITVIDATKLVGSSFTLSIRATDNGTPAMFVAANAIINLKANNSTPTFSLTNGVGSTQTISAGSATIALDENTPASKTQNGLLVGTVKASDVDEIGGQFTITMVDPLGAFAFDAATGKITVLNASRLNYEATRSAILTFSVTDHGLAGFAGTLVSTLKVTFNLNDLNEAPVIASAATASIAENNTGGALLTTVRGTDPDLAKAQKLTYALVSQVDGVGKAVSRFAINSATGALTVKTANSLDYEKMKSYSIVVQATDNGSPALSTRQTIAVSVTDVNEAPVGIALSSAAIPAGTAPIAGGTKIATLQGLDLDTTLQTFTYTLVSGTGGGDNTKFSLNATTGVLSTATTLARKGTFSILVRVTDQNGLSFTKTITIVT